MIGLDLEQSEPEDATLKVQFREILKEGAQRLAGNFKEHATPSEDGFWCGDRALDEIKKTCEIVEERLMMTLGPQLVMKEKKT